MKHSLAKWLAAVAIGLATVVAASSAAYAQGSFFTSLSGTVIDPSGAVIPGADVKIKNNGTGEEFTAVTGSDGGFVAFHNRHHEQAREDEVEVLDPFDAVDAVSEGAAKHGEKEHRGDDRRQDRLRPQPDDAANLARG